MTSNILSTNEKETWSQKRISELERANQELRSEILERKQAEKELREEEFRLLQAQEFMEATTKGTDIIIASIDTNFCYIYFNKAYQKEVQRLSGKEIQVGESMIETFANLPEQQKIVIEQWSDALEGNSTERTLAFGDPGLYRKIYEVHRTPIRDAEGKIVGAGEVARNVTEKISTEEALRKSEERYRILNESLRDAFAHTSMNGRIIEFNDLYCKMLGYSPEEILKLTYQELTPERWHAIEDDIVHEQIIPRGYSDVYEKEYRRKDGGIIPVELRTILLKDESGRPNGMWAIIRGISERKKAEEALKKARQNLEDLVKQRTEELEKAYDSLKESERGLAEAQRMAHIGSWDWNLVTNEVYWSDELYRIFGRSPQDPGATYNEMLSLYIHPDDREYVDNSIKKALEGELFSFDSKIISANGEEKAFHAQTEIIYDTNHNPVRMRGIFQDITESKKAEEKLRESEEKYRNIVETANEGIGIIDNEFKLTFVNKKLEDMIGYRAGDMIGKQLWFFLSEEAKHNVNLILERGLQDFENPELKFIRKDGSSFWAQVNAKPIFDNYGKLISIITMLSDINKRKEAEESLAKIEIARKKEIHHRIKNNLQVISSLLDLQGEKFKGRKNIQDSEVLEAFMESQNRVISMALIHEELYKGEGTETLDFSTYIKELAENLFHTYSFSSKSIHLNMDLEKNAFFDMDTAVPLGIIVNELISNSLKHAFNGRDNGEIQIKLRREEGECKKEDNMDTSFTLTVSDNGVGIPENIDIEDLDSLGIQLITTLADQLDGKLELKRNNGTVLSRNYFALTMLVAIPYLL
ncbi:hypothetical protein DU57_14675 [Methanosarcina mazei]|uniref:Histidine kinase n=1 Tax=Methanosarcina mazei TaxID=2209 RepID=A0A0F8KAF2_METMZ|nr:hypothetical protein DU59_16915 [Methanosarcina mazei]KKG88793.1 hypothetical protein DU57_14675 [Methanosarcina mazei]KKH10547.1 hypothetical protein DU42_02655 [Methanosarcina mazei]